MQPEFNCKNIVSIIMTPSFQNLVHLYPLKTRYESEIALTLCAVTDSRALPCTVATYEAPAELSLSPIDPSLASEPLTLKHGPVYSGIEDTMSRVLCCWKWNYR